MSELIAEIKRTVDAIGVDEAKKDYQARHDTLVNRIVGLRAVAAKRDWTSYQRNQWVKQESDRLNAERTTLANAIRLYLP